MGGGKEKKRGEDKYGGGVLPADIAKTRGEGEKQGKRVIFYGRGTQYGVLVRVYCNVSSGVDSGDFMMLVVVGGQPGLYGNASVSRLGESFIT